MTRPEDDGKGTPGNAPSWVDEVLGRAGTSGPDDGRPQDLRIPAATPAPTVSPSLTKLAVPQPDLGARPITPPASNLDRFGEPARPQAPQPLGRADVAQKKLIAGLLGIFLGSLGVHKFYLGNTTPGAIMLGVNVGVWIVAFVLGLLTLGFGLVITLPLAALVSSAVGLLGLVEGIIYLTRSDADFEREYILGQKAWL
ncbi:TM2 domain-containing protein [Deinococcus sp. 12RED42]|uniref:TM2 domain-containing protein n=1 Tax=Deinococcus sp. 12RED42 TaxID=2745872 RepID=UPI001E3A29F5|nr:TM2 domain-containing protein [Deinococcus sp. 12RED42]MCD0165084.1 TM2 domain-containing protein [Deinococcus sp. 12RED42]